MDSWRELLGLDNHYKLVATVSWLFGLVTTVVFMQRGASPTFLLSWGSLAFLAPYGLKGLTAWLNRPSASAEVSAVAQETQAAIAARRANGDHEVTP